MPPMIEATLVEGSTYSKGTRVFEFQVPQVISQKDADYLADNAIKSVKQESGGKISRIPLQMFKFRTLDDDDDAPEAGTEPEGGYVPDPNPDESLDDDDIVDAGTGEDTVTATTEVETSATETTATAEATPTRSRARAAAKPEAPAAK